jgi:hypothetical protein
MSPVGHLEVLDVSVVVGHMIVRHAQEGREDQKGQASSQKSPEEMGGTEHGPMLPRSGGHVKPPEPSLFATPGG